MFEGLVRQLLLGYLGQYIKDIQREQLKITLWNEEVLLENVDLILEAFDYLQLPIALRKGNVGKLSIRIPWKKLGWDPIIIILEDVEICAGQREDKEWTAETIERREFAGKKAKLAAAELAKLSRRVCDNQTGKSFISYITAKILDGIQVTIRNVHVQYMHMSKVPGITLFGLKLSSLMVTRQNPTGFSSVKLKGAQVNKLIEVHGLEFYCTGHHQADHDLLMVDGAVHGSKQYEDKIHLHILAPLDMTVFLSVNRSGKLENDAPQYSVNVELSRLVIFLDEIQLQQILTVYDYLSICQLREKYGRYRPWRFPLEKKPKGWQIAWWQYAQRSVLWDVRKRLRKNSWKYLGDQLNRRRKYVKLYKIKLKCLREDKVIDDNVLRELEEMEKEAEIDDILIYRSAAEHELEDYLENSFSGVGSSSLSSDKCLEDGRLTGKPRGWLNWLSRGMLGASGTDDSGHFSGVISDDVVQDIYEATKFHPMMSLNDDAAANVKIYLSLVKVTVREICATLRSIELGYAIAELLLEDISIDCKVREESAAVLASVNSARLLNPLDKEAILSARRDECKVEHAFVNIQVDILSPNSDISSLVKVGIQPLEILCNLQFMKNLSDFFDILKHLNFQNERILSSLNGIADTKARLLSKIEYVVSSRNKMLWDVRFSNILIVAPWKNAYSELHKLILEAREICYSSKVRVDSTHSDMQNSSQPWPELTSSTSDDLFSFQNQDLYDSFEICISNFEVKMIIPQSNGPLSLIDKSSVSLALVSCIISDEPSLKGLDVNMNVSSLLFHFSPKIYEAIMGLYIHSKGLYCMLDSAASGNQSASGKIHSDKQILEHDFWFSLAANLESVSFEVDLESGKDSYILRISLQMLDVWFEKKELPECSTSTKAIKIVAYKKNVGDECLILSSVENLLSSVENPPNHESACQTRMASRDETLSENSVDTISLSDRFFLLHYQEYRNIDSVCPVCRVIVNNIDLHCYPLIVGQLICFINRILSVSTKVVGNQDVSPKYVISAPGCQVEKVDISDIGASASSNEACILLKNFPFATVCNFGPIYALEKSLIHPIPDWRKQAGLVEWLPRNTPLSTFMARYLSSPYSRRISLASAADYLPHVCNDSSSVKVELSISCMKVYFHDSSCILGTLSLPAANSLFSISDDLSDIFVSTVGTTFSSSLWASPVHDFLWGPVSPDLPPVLNLRVKKDAVGLEESVLNLCFGIQHVSCTLSPDCLSTIISYFASPDWSFGGTDQPVSGDLVDINPGNKMGIVYNVEILGSNLFTPTHSDVSQCLKLDIPQFYISFIGNGTKDVAMKEIPSDLLVMADKIADRSNCLNLFGRDLSLLFLLQKDGGFKPSEVGGGQHFDLISQLSADAWVRIPCVASSCPICIVAVVLNCQFIAEDERSVAGFNGLFDVINQFSIIDEEFKFYTGDVFQFRHLKKSLVDNPTNSQRTTATVTEIRSCVRSMSVRLHQPVKDSITSEVSAHADMQFFLSADLVNDEPQLLDISFSSLALFSSLNSFKLAEASSSCPGSPVLDINFVKLARGGNKFDIFLPSLQIWLHIYDWGRIIDAVKYYSEELSEQLGTDQLTNGLEFYPNDLARVSTIDVSLDSHESPSVSCIGTPEIIEKDNDLYLLGMEEAGIMLHVPILLNDHAFSVFRDYSVASENDLGNGTPGNQCGFVSFCMQTRCSELIIDHQTLKLKVNLEKASASVEFYSDNNRQMRHLLQLSQIILQANVINYQMADMSIKLEIQCETLDGWITSHVICLWSSLQFELPEEGTSHLAFSMLELVVKLGKVTILLTDGKWSPGGPLLEIVFRNMILSSNVTEEGMKGLVESDLQVNFNNVDKVMWEPFLEPWNFQLKLDQKHDKTALLNNARTMDILVQSESQLNLNVTESLIEVISRTISMVEDSWGQTEMDCPSKDSGFASYQMDKDQYPRSSAPYVIQNLTSLPLLFSVYKGQLHSEFLDLSLLPSQDINALEPGSSFPIYINETPEEQLIRHLPSQSSDRLSDKHLHEAAHHYILIQLEGTSAPSGPISIDLVGHSYFEVNFSKSSSKSEVHNKVSARRDRKVESAGEGSLNTHEGFVVPVVVDVSVEQYTKLIRLYSTVVLLNATHMPLEVRFDIPFGVSPKILDPVYPGQEFPLPLHLAEAGRVRYRPLGNTYLWSEAYSISGILSHENRISFLRPIVCYPSHPSSDPFRCCILVNAKCLPSAGKLKKGFPVVNSHENMGFTRSPDHIRHDSDTSKPRYIYWMTLSSPLVLKNYLPEEVSITIENGSVTRHASLSEVETSFSHVDSSHDLTITFHVHGFRSSIVKFPRGDIFSSTAKLDGTKYSLLETIMFDSESYSGRLYVNIEKIMDSLSGAREVCISVPFLLYNCTGFPLVVSDSLNETKGHGFSIPSCFSLDEQGMNIGRRNGLAVLSSNQDLHSIVVKEKPTMASQINHILERSTEGTSVRKPSSAFSSLLQANSITHRSDSNEILIPNSQEEYLTRSQMGLRCNSFAESKEITVDAFMYSPEADCSPNEVMVKISRGISGRVADDVVNGPWSEPFPLVPPTGSITVLIPQLSSSQGHLVSVSASAAPFLGKTRIISFQHRYVISNACNKAFSYKQKGTGLVLHLEAGQHSTIEWTDTTRDLLVSIRFDEPGWQWSGCFLPDHLGDTQIKMRNFISGAVILIRIEVQSADMSFKEEKIVGRPTGDSGTHLILVSIDDTGFMPYRIDNFSKERIRVCQQRCESFETLVNAYTSCPYAWDEPCNPHRLIVEVPGERVVGSYALDDVKEFSPVHFPATLEKPERTLFISVHSEGAIKVLSIIDSTYHIKNDVNSNKLSFPKDKRNLDQKLEPYDHYKERITINVSFIGISLMNSFAEELLFACAEGVAIELMQSLDQQKFSLQISYLQIDNQLHNTPYPVILSFNSENKGQLANQIKMIDDPLRISASASGKLREPVFYLAIAKWRNKDTAPVSFEYISLRVADFHLDLEQDILISLIYFAKTISSRLQFRVLDNTESILHPVYPNFTSVSGASTMTPTNTVSSLRNKQYLNGKTSHDTNKSTLFALVVPIGAPWQQIHMLARQQKKIYIEQLDLEPINFSLSFSSTPWVLRNGVLTSGESLIHRGIMALADIEGAQIHLKHLSLSHQLASWESVQEILVRHYTRQFIHEMYKLFGSAGVLGNPIGFARSVGLGIKDFLSVPVRGLFKSPAGLVTGVAQGTTSLVSNTVYAVSDAATQFSKVAHKGIVAFTFDDQMVAKMDKQQKGTASQSKGLINGFFEGLTGLLQSPVKGAEKHGIPGVFSGVVLGVTGLVTRPAASILEVTGKTAQSIRNRSRSHLASQHFRVRLPRALSRESALRAYSWEEAIGTSILAEADEGMKLRDETLIMCKTLKQGGRFVVITYRLILVVSCSSLVDLGKPTFRGIPAEPEWVIEADIQLDSVIHTDCNGEVVHIVASSSDTFLRQNNSNMQRRIGDGSRGNRRNASHTLSPLFHADVEFVYNDEADNFLAVLLATIEKAKEGGCGSAHFFHQCQLRQAS